MEHNSFHADFPGRFHVLFRIVNKNAFSLVKPVFAAQQMIAEKYPEKNWDYLQTFSYKGIKFWCIEDAKQREHQKEEHITFLLPTDY